MPDINFSNLNAVDIIILGIFLFSMVMGFARGFISEIISLLALIAAFIIAIRFTMPLSNYFTGSSTVQGVVSQTSSVIGVSTAQPVSYVSIGISFAILFGATLLAGAIVKFILNMIFTYGILGIGNSILGGAFGLLKGFFYNLVLIFLVQLSPLASKPVFAQSQLVIAYQPAVQWLGNVISPALSNLKSKIGSTVQGVGSSLQGLTNGI